MLHIKRKSIGVCCLCVLLLLTFGGCQELKADQPGVSGSGNGSYSEDSSQNSTNNSTSSQSEAPISQSEPISVPSVKGGNIISVLDDLNGRNPNGWEHSKGTQSELERFKTVLISPDLYRIDGVIGYEAGYEGKLSDETASDILNYLINLSKNIVLTEEIPNPSTGLGSGVNGYDKDGNFLFGVGECGFLTVHFKDDPIIYDFYCGDFDFLPFFKVDP